MSPRRLTTWFGLPVLLTLALLLGSGAQPTRRPEPTKPINEIEQTFPSNDVPKTAWKVRWSTQNGFGLIIQDAWFKKQPSEPWLQVLGDARIGEIFVPYHSGSPRFWDVSYNFGLCPVTQKEAGAFGKVLGTPPTVVQEIRDRGLVWYDYKGARRGQELVLFATLNAANYRYTIHYAFRDDGSIGFRLGSGGRNYGSRELEAHMHNGLWRIDVNLDGPDNNTVWLVEHIEPDGQHRPKARTERNLFNEGKEGFADWHAEKFTSLRVVNDRRKNARGEPFAYDLVPSRMGNARHFGSNNERCTEHDFWVTKNRTGEIYYTKVTEYVFDPQQLAQKNLEPENIVNTDVVLWHSAPGHHDPRSEDGEMQKSTQKSKTSTNFVGSTPYMWSGFDLVPRNIWDRTPLYP